MAANHPRPRVYFEEWDDPLISGISWVSQLIEIAGGEDVFADLAVQKAAKDRIAATAARLPRLTTEAAVTRAESETCNTCQIRSPTDFARAWITWT